MDGKWIRVSVKRANNSGSVESSAVKVVVPEDWLRGTAEIPDTIKKGEMINMIDWSETPPVNSFELENQTAGSQFAFQWQVADSAEGPWTDIEYAGQDSYYVGVDAGKYIRVVITTMFRNYPDPDTPANPGSVRSNACLVQEADPLGEKVITKFERFSGAPTTVYRGKSISLVVDIGGENLEYEDTEPAAAKWSLVGDYDTGTFIDESGYYPELKCDINETATKITLYAESALFPEDWNFEVEIDVDDYVTRTFTITGLTGYVDDGTSLNITIWTLPPEGIYLSGVANGSGEIEGGEVTVELLGSSGFPAPPWTTNGEFYVQFSYYDWDAGESIRYWYTNGAAIEDDLTKNPKYDFQGLTASIDFSEFELEPEEVPDLEGIKITITGLSSYTDGTNASITVSYDAGLLGIWTIGSGYAGINDGEVTINLLDSTGTAGWKGGNGTACFIKLTIGSFFSGPMVDFVYTEGESLADIGLTAPIYWDDFYDAIVTESLTYDFLTSGEEEFEIGFDQFVDASGITYDW
jgi:hypothetical protein